MKKTMLFIAALLSGLLVAGAGAAPLFQAAGTAVTGTGVVNPAWPAHAIDDVALLFVESTGGQAATLSIPAGFAAVANSPQSTGLTTNGTRITVFWARATSTAMATPRVADPGDHVYAQIITYRGVINTGNPWDVTGGGVKAVASTSVTVTGVTTTVPDTRIVQVVSRDNDRTGAHFSAETNASLTGITERSDGGTTSGNGGGFAVWDGVKATAGATGNTTATISRSTVNAFLTIVLRPPPLHHIRIEHNGYACTGAGAPAQITLKACANLACTAPHYTATDVTGINLAPTGGGYTWSPANPQTIAALSGGINSGSITLARNTAGTATLAITGTPTPAPINAYECYNVKSGTSGDCILQFSGSALSFDVSDHTADSPQVVTLTSCKGTFASTSRSIKFWSTYVNPLTGTQQGKVVAGTGNADCTTGYSALSTSSASPTTLSLAFDANSPPRATFSLCYPDAGQVQVDTQYDGSALNTPPDSGVVILGSDGFIAAPHHFSLSNVNCISGCSVVANPGAANAAGAAFMKAGNPFSLTVTAYNTNGAVTPNFGKEATPEGVALTGTNIADPDLTTPGTLTGVFGAFSNGVAIADGITFLPDGITRSTPFSWDEVGIMTLTARLASATYLSASPVLREVTAPATGNIGRFIPDHFTITTDPDTPIQARADLAQIATTVDPAGAAAGSTVIPVVSTAGFSVGGKIRIVGAGTGGSAFTATVTAIDTVAFTLTLDSAILDALVGGEGVIEEWGSYMGERFNAQFTLNATALNDAAVTQNYQGAYAKLNPAAAGNQLRFGAVNAGIDLTARLDTSMLPGAGTTSFASGSATVVAPLAIARCTAVTCPANTNPNREDGPYTLLQIGIAPTAETDGVRMKAPYDLNVGGTADHTSIMNALVQDVTTVLYGRIKLASAHGSELLPLPIAATVQYWNATNYVTSITDSGTQFNTKLSTAIPAGNVQATIVKGPLALGNVSVVTPGLVTFANGVNTFKLTAPNVAGSVDLAIITAPDYLLPSTTGRATFGVYKGASEFIYLRENY